jgi:hypothetical protein
MTLAAAEVELRANAQRHAGIELEKLSQRLAEANEMFASGEIERFELRVIVDTIANRRCELQQDPRLSRHDREAIDEYEIWQRFGLSHPAKFDFCQHMAAIAVGRNLGLIGDAFVLEVEAICDQHTRETKIATGADAVAIRQEGRHALARPIQD